jgi:cation diffusion facilitator family transporter
MITGSYAILSDAAESVVHIAATGVAAFSLWYAHQIADDRHPYGHGKIAYFSAGFEGAMILSAAGYIYYSSVLALIQGPELRSLGTGILIAGALALINLALGTFLVRVGRTRNAFILVANGKHVLTDMWTSAGVVAGVVIIDVGLRVRPDFHALVYLDPVVAILVASNILREAVRLIHTSFQGLLDEADPRSTPLILSALQHAVDQGRIKGYHQLKHRQSNDVMWVEVHMLVPGHTTTADAHAIVTDIEHAIDGLFPLYKVHVTTHIEPEHHDAAHPDGHPGLHDPFAGSASPGE